MLGWCYEIISKETILNDVMMDKVLKVIIVIFFVLLDYLCRNDIAWVGVKIFLIKWVMNILSYTSIVMRR